MESWFTDVKRVMDEVTTLTGNVTIWSSVSGASTGAVAVMSSTAGCCSPAWWGVD